MQYTAGKIINTSEKNKQIEQSQPYLVCA